MRGSSRTCECVKALMFRSLTPPHNLLCQLVTRPNFLSSRRGILRIAPYTCCNCGENLGHWCRIWWRGHIYTPYAPVLSHSTWKVVQRSRPLFSFLSTSGAWLGPGGIPHHLWAPVPRFGSFATIYPPAPISEAWCGCQFGTKSVPRERPTSGLWQCRRPSSSMGWTDLDPETPDLLAWQGVEWPPVLGFPSPIPEKAPIGRPTKILPPPSGMPRLSLGWCTERIPNTYGVTYATPCSHPVGTNAPPPPTFKRTPYKPEPYPPPIMPWSLFLLWTPKGSGFRWPPRGPCLERTPGTARSSYWIQPVCYWLYLGITCGPVPATWEFTCEYGGVGRTPRTQRRRHTTVVSPVDVMLGYTLSRELPQHCTLSLPGVTLRSPPTCCGGRYPSCPRPVSPEWPSSGNN